MSIADNLSKTLSSIPANVSLVAVSKTKPNSDIIEAYEDGQRIFGENKVQELAAKAEELPNDIKWHMIGHLQTNKVKYIARFVSLIHSVESMKLVKVINKEAVKHDRVIDCLLEIKIGKEEAKFGLSASDVNALLCSSEYTELKNIRFVGVMGMATFTEDDEIIRTEFKKLKSIFTNLKESFFSDKDSFKELSMGMSADYQLAIKEGSTMVRVGSAIFGARNYV
ncbi:MAG: YggS family pyridoxal phosphate-dependent enzyme [Flavobacteriales bacterium]|nr:YggS family pyridoxal phosphate-dependent enzyme [Flavobacteriales bacterium]